MKTLGNISSAHTSYIKNLKQHHQMHSKKNGIQQKKHPLIQFENNGTLQKWHITNTPPKTEKYDTHKKWCLTKMTYLAKECPKVVCQGLSGVMF